MRFVQETILAIDPFAWLVTTDRSAYDADVLVVAWARIYVPRGHAGPAGGR